VIGVQGYQRQLGDNEVKLFWQGSENSEMKLFLVMNNDYDYILLHKRNRYRFKK